MSDPWRRAAAGGLLFLLVAASGVCGYALLFSRFAYWDDEGYFLLALRAYQEGGGLYERIETIYGPFYFQFVHGIFSLLRIPFENVSARWFVLCLWIASCLLVHRHVKRVTASPIAALLAYFLSFTLLENLQNEPLHPGGLIVLLLSALLLLSPELEGTGPRRASWFACGAITAAIALSKLNVGFFVVVAFAVFWLRTAPGSRTTMALRVGGAVLLPVLPILWMAPLLDSPGIAGFVVLVSVALLPFGFLPGPGPQDGSFRSFLAYLLGGLAATSVVLSLCLLGGTSLGAVWNALVLGGLQFVGSFVQPPRHEWSAVLLVAVAIPIVLGAVVRWTTWLGPIPRTVLKLAGGLVLLALCLAPPRTAMLGLPLVWLVAVPGSAPKCGFDYRLLLGLLVVLQSLHAYPVAGSQVAFFAFLLPVVGIRTVWDAWREAPASWRKACGRLRWRTLGTATGVLILATCHSSLLVSPSLWTEFKESVPLDLPGARSIRLREHYAAELQWVATNLQHNADTFLGIPDLHSFYGWSSLPPPVPFYTHTWMLDSDDDREEKLLQALLAAKRPAIVVDRGLIGVWMSGRALRRGPLVRAVEEEFGVAGAVGDYELLIPRGSQADLVLTAIPEPAPPGLLDRYGAAGAVRLSFPAMEGVHVARVVVRDTETGRDVFDSAAGSPDRRLTVLSSAWTEFLRGDPPVLINLSKRSDVHMLFPPTTLTTSSWSGLIRAYDQHGRIVARLLIPRKGRARRPCACQRRSTRRSRICPAW